jgi:hypothetical protein
MRALLYFLQSRRVPRFLRADDAQRRCYAAYNGVAVVAASYRTGGCGAHPSH